MSLSFKKGRAPSDANEEPIDIDVTPVMNVFIILFPFLISMSVFTHYAMLDFRLPPNVGMGLDAGNGKPKLKLTALVKKNYLAITLGDKMLDSIPVDGTGKDNYEKFATAIGIRRATAEFKDEIVVASSDGVAIQRVVFVMDRCRNAGFSSIGISNATEDPTGKKGGLK